MKLIDCLICGEPFQTSGPGKYCEGCRREARKRRERKARKSGTQREMGGITTTKKELSQLYWLNQEIAREKQRLEELECAARGGAAKISGMPHVGGNTRTQEEYVALIAEQRDLVELKVRQLVIEYNRLSRYIASVGDSLTRQILALRYIDGLSWLQVANRIGGGNTADSVKKQCYRFLEKEKSCPECPGW